MDRTAKKKRKFTWTDGVALAVILVVLIAVLTMASRVLSSRSLRVTEAEYQSYTDSIAAEALVIRGEYLLSAPAAGYFKPYYEEGSKVPAGCAIGAMSDEQDGEGKSEVNTGGRSGMLSFQLDGWEEILNADALDSTDRSALIKLYTDGSVDNNAADTIDSTAAGRALAKIVDNFQGFHVLVWLDQPPHQYVSNGTVRFTYEKDDGASDVITAEIEENGMLDDGGYYLLLNVPSTISDFISLRHLDCTLLGDTCSGVLLPQTAVVEDEAGQTGVWTVSGRQLVFTPITVTGHMNGDYLTDDIREHTLIVTAPAKVRQGMKYYK